jgi:hypothetical protein
MSHQFHSYFKEIKSYTYKIPCIRMTTASLFIIDKNLEIT